MVAGNTLPWEINRGPSFTCEQALFSEASLYEFNAKVVTLGLLLFLGGLTMQM